MSGKWVHGLYILNLGIQGLFCLVSPIALLTALAWYLVERRGMAGSWLYAALIFAGVLIGFFSMIKFIVRASAQIQALEEAQRQKKKQPSGDARQNGTSSAPPSPGEPLPPSGTAEKGDRP